jgi:hypothetical protein
MGSKYNVREELRARFMRAKLGRSPGQLRVPGASRPMGAARDRLPWSADMWMKIRSFTAKE